MPLIWRKPGLPGVHPEYSIRAMIQRVNPTPLICSTNLTVMSLRGHQREVSPVANDSSGLTPASRLLRNVGQWESSSLRDAAHSVGKRKVLLENK
ncbi:hypothetical protein TNCV_4894721 [Trichonephila clavipes]|nr:hypothetical protein TNCV_4894721 [Trichonephila clavipes]